MRENGGDGSQMRYMIHLQQLNTLQSVATHHILNSNETSDLLYLQMYLAERKKIHGWITQKTRDNNFWVICNLAI